MAKYLPLPKKIADTDKSFIKDAIEVSEQRFKGDLFGEVNSPITDPVTTFDGRYHWTSGKEFLTYITDLTETSDIRSANAVLYQTLNKAPEYTEPTMTGAPEYPVSATTITKPLGEQQEIERVKRSESEKQAQEHSKQIVEAGIKKQQEIYAQEVQRTKALEAELKKQKIYFEIEEKVAEAEEVKNLRQQAEADPKKFIKDVVSQFKGSPNLKNLPADEAKIATEQAAVTTYDVVTENPNSVTFQAVVVNNIVSDPELFKKIAPSLEDQRVIKDIGDYLSDSKTAQFELANQFADLSKTKGASLNVKLFDSPGPGRQELDFSQITSQYADSLNRQSSMLGGLREFGEGEIRSHILLGVGNRLESYIAKLPANSLLSKAYNSEVVQLGLSSLGVVRAAPWVAVEGSWVGRIAVGSGFGPAAGFIQAKTGINLGVKLAAKTGATVAAKTGAKAVITKVTTALSTAIPLPVVNWIIGFVGGEIIGKIIEKIPWDKVKKWSAFILGGLAGLIALPFLGLGAALGITAGATALGAAFGGGMGGLTLGGIGSGIVGFFGAVATATLGAIGMPILVTLLVFPVVVALILFIINSGAYVVPPQLPDSAFVGSGIDIVCSDEKGSVGVPGPSSSSPIADRAWKITYDLYQGFWCFWNRSPSNVPWDGEPRADFPNDFVKYPPNYPEKFDYSLFKRNPNPPENGVQNLFWCTWLVVKAFQENGNNIGTNLYTPDMYNDFDARQKTVAASKALPSVPTPAQEAAGFKQIVPGSVVFFHVTTGPNRLNHVGVVYSVDAGGITLVESNAPLKSQTINFKPGGGTGNLPLMEVKYFGLP